MDTQQMRYFLDVAETEHMTKSAERLRIAQPALSRSIARLEKEIGAKLFAREGRGLRLTAEGRLLKQHIAKALAEIEKAQKELAEADDERRRTVRVRIKAASLLAIEAVSSWMEANPIARIELAQTNHPEESADIAIGPSPSNGCREQRSFTERIMLAAPADMKFDAMPIPLDSLSGHPFVSLDGTLGFRRTCDELCRQRGFAPSVSLESDNPDVVRKAIALGLGVGFWPERSWGIPGARIELIPIEAEGFARSIHIALHGKSGYARDLYDYLVSHAQRVFA